jgi:hypothetical protein
VAEAQRRSLPKFRRALRIGAVTIAVGSLFGGAAFAVRSAPDARGAPEALSPGTVFQGAPPEQAWESAAPKPALAKSTVALVDLAASAAAPAAEELAPARDAARRASRPSAPPVAAAVRAEAQREPESRTISDSRPSPKSEPQRTTNALGYEFGF